MEAILSSVISGIVYILNFYMIVLIASAVLSWVRADESNGIVRFIRVLTDPPSRFLEKKFPSLIRQQGGYIINLSPLILLLLVGLIKTMLEAYQRNLMYG